MKLINTLSSGVGVSAQLFVLKIKEKSHQECYPLATLIEISYLLINFNLSEFRITHMLLITIAIAQYTGVILIQYFSNIPIAIGIIQIL